MSKEKAFIEIAPPEYKPRSERMTFRGFQCPECGGKGYFQKTEKRADSHHGLRVLPGRGAREGYGIDHLVAGGTVGWYARKKNTSGKPCAMWSA